MSFIAWLGEPVDGLLTPENTASACRGAGGKDLANITNIAAECTFVLGAPRRADGVEDTIHMPGSQWTTPLYSCVTVTEALVKTVTFVFNITDDLGGLGILDITDKKYPSQDALPLWGVENVDNTTGLYLADLEAIWGLVSPTYLTANNISAANVSTVRKESLFLPGYPLLSVHGGGLSNLPGVTFPAATIVSMKAGMESSGSGLIDYTGRSNVAMSRRWARLSRSADSVRKIHNLIWTDIAANAVLGTKGLHSSTMTAARASSDLPVPLVSVYHRRIQYHLPFAIPAIIVLVLLLSALVLTSAAVFLGRTGFSKMRRFLNATSAGRIMTSVLLGDERIEVSKPSNGPDGAERLPSRLEGENLSWLRSTIPPRPSVLALIPLT